MGIFDKVGRGLLAYGTLGGSELVRAGSNWLNPEAPGSPDYQAIAAQENAANRPDQNTPYASSGFTEEKVPFGEPFPGAGAPIQEQIAWMQRKQAHEANPANTKQVQNTGFTGGLADVNDKLQGQVVDAMSQPMDWQQFGKLGDGEAAREQAINAAYGQAAKRLDPMFRDKQAAMATQLANQGLDPTSAAARSANSALSTQENDARMGAMNSAIMQGQAAGDSVFRNNMMSRQQAIAEALKQRGMPISEMQMMQGFLGMPGFNQADYMSGAMAQDARNLNEWQSTKDSRNQTVQSGVDLGKTLYSMAG